MFEKIILLALTSSVLIALLLVYLIKWDHDESSPTETDLLHSWKLPVAPERESPLSKFHKGRENYSGSID